MKFIKGMWLGGKAVNNPQNTTRVNKNVVLTKNLGSYTNEDGFNIKCQTYTSKSLLPIGVITLDNDRICVFSIGQNFDEIGVIANDVYTTCYKDLLGFNPNFPIHGTFQKNFRGDTIVAYTDRGNTKPGVANLDTIPDVFDINNLRMFPSYVEPDYDLLLLENGGVLKSGVIYVTARYVDSDRNKTAWFKCTKPVFITENKVSEDFTIYDGCAPDTTTSKSLRVNFNNTDSRFKRLEVGVIQKIDGIITCYSIGEYSLKSPQTQVVISGTETITTLSIQEVLSVNAAYESIYALTQQDNTLYGINLGEASVDSWQKYANNVRVNPLTSKLVQSDYTGTNKLQVGFFNRTFKHGEVYGLYMCLKMLDGSRSRAFHLPGRRAASIAVLPESGATVVVANEDASTQSILNAAIIAGSSGHNYLLEDLDVDGGVKYFQTRDTSYNPSASNSFGFHENLNETYPDTEDFDVWDSTGLVGTLRGERVRHHKFPTIKKIKEKFYPTDKTYGGDFLDIVGIELDLNSLYFPPEVLSKIAGFEIFYAERTPQNSSILGQDIPMCTAWSGSSYVSTGGNWDSLNLYNNKGLSIVRDYLRFHCFDMMQNKSSIFPSFIRNNLAYVKAAELYELNPNGSAYKGADHVSVLVTDLTQGNTYINDSGNNSIAPSSFEDEVRKLSLSKYVPNNVIDGNIDNRFLEEFMFAKVGKARGLDLSFGSRNNYIGGSVGSGGTNTRREALGTLFGPIEQTFLTDLCVLYPDMYETFQSQRLVSAGLGWVVKADGSYEQYGSEFGGDVFISSGSFATYSIRDVDDHNVLSSQLGVKCFKRFLHESVANTDFRYFKPTDDYTYYYPYDKPSAKFVQVGFDYFRDLEPNNFLYNRDYSSIDNLTNVVPFDPNEEFVFQHPNRVARSLRQGEEEQVSFWKTWKIDDYYEMPKNTGEGIGIQGWDDRLIINQRYSSYVTVGNESMSTSEGQVFLGAGDIFRLKPNELLVDGNGYAGCQHRHGSCLTKYGFVWIDAEQGKIFLLNPKGATASTPALQEISEGDSLALQDFFRDSSGGTVDNPFYLSGFSSAFDMELSRLLITKKLFTLNQFGTDLINGVYGVGHYLIHSISNGFDRWIYINEALGLSQIVYVGDSRFWDSSSWTVSYSFDFKCWTSFHDYYPDYIFNTRNKLWSFKNNKLYQHNIKGVKGIYYTAEIFPAYITPVFVSTYATPDRSLVSALFSSLSLNTDVYDSNENLIKEKSVDSILAWNSYQSTGDVDIVVYDKSLSLEANHRVNNIKNAKNTFTFNRLKNAVINASVPFVKDYLSIQTNIDQNSSFELRGALIDKFLIVKLLYKNEKSGNLQYEIHFDDIAILTRPVRR
jgi:hypothetical protein